MPEPRLYHHRWPAPPGASSEDCRGGRAQLLKEGRWEGKGGDDARQTQGWGKAKEEGGGPEESREGGRDGARTQAEWGALVVTAWQARQPATLSLSAE